MFRVVFQLTHGVCVLCLKANENLYQVELESGGTGPNKLPPFGFGIARAEGHSGACAGCLIELGVELVLKGRHLE